MGWGSPSSGARVKKQGKAGWARGWGDGAEEDSERQECPLQMPSLLWSAYGVPQCQGMPVKVSAHSAIPVTMKAEPLLSCGPDSCPSLENALWSLVTGHSSTQMLGQGRSQEPGLHGQDLKVSRASCLCYDSAMFCGSGPSVDVLVCH